MTPTIFASRAARSSIDVDDVLEPDAIPSIDDPEFGSDFDGDPEDELIVVEGTSPRGYSVRIFNFHEIVTDTVGGLSVVVATTDATIHAYENPGYEFEQTAEGLAADSTIWDPRTGESADGCSRSPGRTTTAQIGSSPELSAAT